MASRERDEADIL